MAPTSDSLKRIRAALRRSAPPPGGEKGAALILIFCIIMLIAAILMAIYLQKLTLQIKQNEIARRQSITPRCKKAMSKVIEAIEVEKMVYGEYPRRFNDEFLERYKTIDRYIFNKEIWSPDAGSELKLNTAFGTSYRLTGYCRDGYMYAYDSDDKRIYTQRYTIDDIKPK